MAKDPLEELGQELRTQVAGEFRRAAEEEEFDARLAALRARDLAAVMFELMSRGDTVAVHVGGHVHIGVVTHARGTLATLDTKAASRIHLNLQGAFSITVIERAAKGGKSFDKYGAESFIARLRQFELDATPVEMHVAGRGHVLAGTVDIVAKDHIIVAAASGESTIVPIEHVLAIVEQLP